MFKFRTKVQYYIEYIRYILYPKWKSISFYINSSYISIPTILVLAILLVLLLNSQEIIRLDEGSSTDATSLSSEPSDTSSSRELRELPPIEQPIYSTYNDDPNLQGRFSYINAERTMLYTRANYAQYLHMGSEMDSLDSNTLSDFHKNKAWKDYNLDSALIDKEAAKSITKLRYLEQLAALERNNIVTTNISPDWGVKTENTAYLVTGDNTRWIDGDYTAIKKSYHEILHPEFRSVSVENIDPKVRIYFWLNSLPENSFEYINEIGTEDLNYEDVYRPSESIIWSRNPATGTYRHNPRVDELIRLSKKSMSYKLSAYKQIFHEEFLKAKESNG